MAQRLRLLREWRKWVTRAVEAIKRVYPEAEVYLFGGAAEDRLTVLSDIDLAVVFDKPPAEPPEVLAKIWEALDEHGVPPHYPLEIVVLSREEPSRLRGAKVRLA